MANVTYTIINNSTDTTAIINYFEINSNTSNLQHRLKIPITWNSPFNSTPYTDFTGDSTLRSQSKTYVSSIGNINRNTIQITTNTNLVLSSNSGIQTGWTVFNSNFITSGQTVVSLSGTQTVILSDVPDVVPFNSGTAISFIPPEYILTLNNTSNLEVGWIASGNGYNGETILEVRSGTGLVMSDQPSTTPVGGGTINFTSNEDNMVEISPLSSTTFDMDYDRITSSIGTYTSLVTLYATLGSNVSKNINNFMIVSALPVTDPSSPFYQPPFVGDGGDAPSPCTDDASVSCSAECFSPTTQVTMFDGSKKAIVDIQEGDLVQGLNTINRVNAVLKFKIGTNKLHGFNGIEPFVTSCHPIKTDQGWGAFDTSYLEINWPDDWKMLCKENNGPVVQINSNSKLGFWVKNSLEFKPIQDHNHIDLPSNYTVYNLNLTNDKTFIANDLVVHNKGGCFIKGTLITMHNGELKPIEEVVEGDLVLSSNGTMINRVRFVEFSNSEFKLYAPKGQIPFATINHPICIDNKWVSGDSILTNIRYPWLYKYNIKQLENIEFGYSKGQQVYNLWVTGDHTYQVNGYGTNSLTDDGGWLSRSVEQGYMTKQQIKEVTNAVYNSSSTVAYGSLILSNLVDKLNWRWLTKYVANMMLGNLSKIPMNIAILIVGKLALLVRTIKKL